MNKRINILLPEETIAVFDRMAKPGNRSRFIDRAIRSLVETEGKTSLREQLKTGYRANAERDRQMAAEWFPLEVLGPKAAAKPLKRLRGGKRK